MPRIFDNQTAQLATALRDTLSQALALDACVGYLNLRGWRQIADRVDDLPGIEGERPPALVGMAARPEQMMRGAYSSAVPTRTAASRSRTQSSCETKRSVSSATSW